MIMGLMTANRRNLLDLPAERRHHLGRSERRAGRDCLGGDRWHVADGRRRHIYGAVIGALVMASLDNGMSLMNMDIHFQYVIKGLILLLAVWVDMAQRKK